jgi:16S rRNA (guanine527-N7)-methyltransferase
VGSGAGFPGLVLAVALHVSNARSVVARAEDWARLALPLGGGREAYDAVTARAVASLPVLVEYAAPLLVEGGVLVAWKGMRDAEEEELGRRAADEVGLAFQEARRVEPFPGARDRHLHVYRKVAPTPPRFPRRAGMAAKRPLGG